jgi:DNA-directed RNA polymerase specialized sigma24 family protein
LDYFVEKPEHNAPEIPGDPGYFLASMGIYVFETEELVSRVKHDGQLPDGQGSDFGHHVIPACSATTRPSAGGTLAPSRPTSMRTWTCAASNRSSPTTGPLLAWLSLSTFCEWRDARKGSRMTSASKNLSDPSFPWDAWDRAEQRLQRILAGSNLPTALQEIASDAVFWRFVTCWGRDLPIRNLPAWVSSVLRNELWHLRRRGIPHQLGGLDTSHVQEIQATSEGRPSPELRSLLQANEGGFLSKLSNQERAVYDQIRRNHSLRECAHNLDMSVRDVRTRFRRIRKKLNGILGHLVPPPPPSQ